MERFVIEKNDYRARAETTKWGVIPVKLVPDHDRGTGIQIVEMKPYSGSPHPREPALVP